MAKSEKDWSVERDRVAQMLVQAAKLDKDVTYGDLGHELGMIARHPKIKQWLQRRPESPWLFSTRNGGPINTRYLREMIKRKATRAEITEPERVTPHVLRHTFATDLYRETHNLILAQKALGHANLATTSIYTHVVDDELEQAMRRGRP